jgi:hypothetical protein
VLHESILEAGWPTDAAIPALMAVADDPATKSPACLPHSGPWWNAAEAPATDQPRPRRPTHGARGAACGG